TSTSSWATTATTRATRGPSSSSPAPRSRPAAGSGCCRCPSWAPSTARSRRSRQPSRWRPDVRGGGADGDLLLIPGTVTVAELVAGGGFFADLAATIGQALGLDVRRLRPEGYRPVFAEAVRAELEARPDTRALAVVHHETDLGLLNPVREICGVARERGVLTL